MQNNKRYTILMIINWIVFTLSSIGAIIFFILSARNINLCKSLNNCSGGEGYNEAILIIFCLFWMLVSGIIGIIYFLKQRKLTKI